VYWTCTLLKKLYFRISLNFLQSNFIICVHKKYEVIIVIMFVCTWNFWFVWCIHKCGDCVHDVSSCWLNLQSVFVLVALEISSWFLNFWMVIGQHLKLQFFYGKKKVAMDNHSWSNCFWMLEINTRVCYTLWIMITMSSNVS
jgi:hypothetical protein